MFFGSKTQKPQQVQNQAQAPSAPPVMNTMNAANAPEQNAGAVIFDVNINDFESRVMAASMERPVIVDFWAPWCGPCKQLTPVLESAVTAAGGQVLLAKINIDENPELAQALQVQSVPTVYAFFGGRPVDAFQGAQPESNIKAFIDKLITLARANAPDAINIPEVLKAAAEALAANDLPTAQALYAQILQQDEKNIEAYTGMVRVFIAAKALEQAEGLIESAPPVIANNPSFQAAKTALELAKKAPVGGYNSLVKKLAKNPKDHQTSIDLAEAQFSSGAKEEAIETLLAAIALDRDWNEQAARKTLLRFFEALGHGDPLTVAARKKLSSLLFS
ncbi:MAG: thioredoxin [Alphaproteobacteria bacterium]|nr:thioredoxin [Alphaproteobacteria bacterium]